MLWEWGLDLELGAIWSQQVEDWDSEAKWGQVEIRNRKKDVNLHGSAVNEKWLFCIVYCTQDIAQ